MLKDSDKILIERFKNSLIERGIPLYKTVVFGSRARGDAGPDSDLDVLVLVKRMDPTTRRVIRHCAWEIGFEADILIQTVIMTREEAEQEPEQSSLFMLAVNEEGVPV